MQKKVEEREKLFWNLLLLSSIKTVGAPTEKKGEGGGKIKLFPPFFRHFSSFSRKRGGEGGWLWKEGGGIVERGGGGKKGEVKDSNGGNKGERGRG